jgi:hypothetical protein
MGKYPRPADSANKKNYIHAKNQPFNNTSPLCPCFLNQQAGFHFCLFVGGFLNNKGVFMYLIMSGNTIFLNCHMSHND